MPFYFNHPAGKFDLEDLPLDRWVTIQGETGLQWHEVLTGTTLVDAKVATVVVREVCAHLGIDIPPLTIKTLMETVVYESGESVPEQYVDGMPDPKATDTAPTTT